MCVGGAGRGAHLPTVTHAGSPPTRSHQCPTHAPGQAGARPGETGSPSSSQRRSRPRTRASLCAATSPAAWRSPEVGGGQRGGVSRRGRARGWSALRGGRTAPRRSAVPLRPGTTTTRPATHLGCHHRRRHHAQKASGHEQRCAVRAVGVGAAQGGHRHQRGEQQAQADKAESGGRVDKPLPQSAIEQGRAEHLGGGGRRAGRWWAACARARECSATAPAALRAPPPPPPFQRTICTPVHSRSMGVQSAASCSLQACGARGASRERSRAWRGRRRRRHHVPVSATRSAAPAAPTPVQLGAVSGTGGGGAAPAQGRRNQTSASPAAPQPARLSSRGQPGDRGGAGGRICGLFR